MRDALAAAMGKQDVYSGEIWVIPDQRVTFGDYNEERRSFHDSRYVLVIQGDEIADNTSCDTISICPLSSQVQRKRTWEEMISGEETPLTSPSIVKLHLIQPVPRRTLLADGDFIGVVSDTALTRIRLHLVTNLGIV